mgnify:CR=1 FL=1
MLLQVVIHGIADNWSSFNDDTLVEKAVRSQPGSKLSRVAL